MSEKKRGRPRKDGPRTPSGKPSTNGARGRWPADRAPKLADQVGVKLTTAQHERVFELAKAAGLTPAEWVRGLVERELVRADHARQVVAHLEAVGGLAGAVP